ncbi:MAG: ribonuclease HII [Leptolyngbyaceae cyanobacterium SL_7_1]|nr:ribonuclease HII [Leptolyngbyaceae cyanobacterium SL_7_1]
MTAKSYAEKAFSLNPDATWIAGVDEVGRGALFGPVVAAAVILPGAATDVLINAGVTDSKQLTPLQRERLIQLIYAEAIDCRIGISSVREIDRFNILNASLLAMRRAISRLQPQPTLCLIDGNQSIPELAIAQQALIKGDQHCLPIAAASIVAKVWRDRLMVRLAQTYPGYDLGHNKGYGTAKHRQALAKLGASHQHRKSFRPCH